MLSFKDISIRNKLIVLTSAISFFALVISSSTNFFIEIKDTRKQIIENLAIDVHILAENAVVPLDFNLPDHGTEMLQKLVANPNISQGIIYDTAGNIFATYIKEGSDSTIQPVQLIENQWFEKNTLQIIHQIYYKGYLFGYIYIKSETDILDRIKNRSINVILTGFLAFVFAILFASYAQRFISNPILKLTKFTSEVSKNNDYSLRIKPEYNDETGVLYDKLNNFLSTIHQRESELDNAINALKENQVLLRSIINNSSASIYLKTIEGKYLIANEAFSKLFGKSLNDILNATSENLFPSNIEETLKKNDFSVYTHKKVIQEELTLELNGNNLTFVAIKFPVFYKNVTMIGGIFTDISERIRSEKELLKYRNHLEDLVLERTKEIKSINQTLARQKEELEAAVKRLQDTQSQLIQSEKLASIGTLTAGIAHEINNPVNYISSGIEGLKIAIADFVDLMKKYEEVDVYNASQKLDEITAFKEELEYDFLMTSIQKLTDNIQSGVSRTTEIIKSLRTFSRLDESELSQTDIHTQLDSTLIMLKNKFKNRIELTKNYGDIPQIKCYPGKINQVFMNLLANAIQSIKGTGDLEIATYNYNESHTVEKQILNLSNDDRGIIIKIKDSGEGIGDEIKTKIFEPFFSTKKIGEGTGLGLSISYSIIEEHEGKINFISEIGKGTAFYIFLPDKKFS